MIREQSRRNNAARSLAFDRDFRLERMRRHRLGAAFGALLLLALALASARPAAAASTCADLLTMPLDGGAVTSAIDYPGPTFTGPDGTVYPGLPAFCQVTATLTPSSDSLVNVWIWLPINTWNGRFEGVGNGGYAGSIAVSVPEMLAALQSGTAVASSDMGTVPSSNNDADALVGHPEKWTDFGYRATHAMTVASKAIVDAFYGQGPKHSYFYGCSTGGQQALMEAERFPDDYDGIIAGDPAANRTHVHTSVLYFFNVTHQLGALFTTDDLNLITNSVVAACNVKSGGLAADAFLTDPRQCDWSPDAIACTSALQQNCLAPAKVAAAKTIYDGPHNPSNGHLIFPGAVKGGENASELGWSALESTPEPQFGSLFKWVFGPTFIYPDFDYNVSMATLDGFLAPILNANATDLSAFNAHGGKLLMFHGWADPLIAPQDSINYYNRLVDGQKGGLKTAQTFARLFMVPGMWHCSGGPGPNAFGNLVSGHVTAPPPPAIDAQHDIQTAIQKWVEQGVAPETLIATKYASDQQQLGIQMQRPLCAYPKVPKYSGGGDPNAASSFVCVDSQKAANPTPSSEYLN